MINKYFNQINKNNMEFKNNHKIKLINKYISKARIFKKFKLLKLKIKF